MSTAIQILSLDSVATAVSLLHSGETVRITGVGQGAEVTAHDEIPSGHKIALKDIGKGEHILKYGEVIGAATEDIAAGCWVHVHNCRGVKARRFED
ncbi:MAG: UxaA family hydrolase [Roseovarius sp.]